MIWFIIYAILGAATLGILNSDNNLNKYYEETYIIVFFAVILFWPLALTYFLFKVIGDRI